VLSVLPSVAEMQTCIERKRKNRGGGISVSRSPAEVQEAGGIWSARAAASLQNLQQNAEQAALIAANAAANLRALASQNPTPAMAAKANEASNKASIAAEKAKNAAEAAAAGGGGPGDVDWDHPDTQVLSLREALSEKDPRAYLLLRWLLSA